MILAPKPFNIGIVIFYCIIFTLRNTILKPKPQGTITHNNQPLPYAIIRIYSALMKNEVTHKVTDENGKYFCLIANGTYYAIIEQKNPDGTYTPIFTSPIFEVKKGYVGEGWNL
jgi:hypothetical protein